MYALERDYWWFQGRRRIILTMLQQALRQTQNGSTHRSFLDVGCGTGMLMEDLKQHGTVVGVDFSPTALTYCMGRKLDNLARGDAARLPIRSNSVDVITALDLVEHVKEDTMLMGEFYRVLRPGGVAILCVPAHKSLWSSHDVALHHFRRYEKSEFHQLVKSSGFTIKRYSFSMLTAYFPAFVFRKLKNVLPSSKEAPKTDEFPIPRFLNSALRHVVNLEARLLSKHDLPVGLSLLCIAVKPH